MSRPIGSTKSPSYCLHKATDRAYGTLGGKPVYLGQYVTDERKAAYRRVVGEWMAAGSAPSTSSDTLPPTTTTVTMIADAFWTHAQKPAMQARQAPYWRARELLGCAQATAPALWSDARRGVRADRAVIRVEIPSTVIQH